MKLEDGDKEEKKEKRIDQADRMHTCMLRCTRTSNAMLAESYHD
jgi:hypothetical protein